jgi:hypothetical protein
MVTAVIEAGTGLMSLVRPSAPLALLLGVTQAAPETIFTVRLLGTALTAIGVACWLGRSDGFGPSQLGLIAGAFVYDVVVAVLLAYAASFLTFVGLALWPAVGLHAALAIWCGVCLLGRPREAPVHSA